MDSTKLLFIICVTAGLCYGLERYVSWIAHVSAVCMTILVAMILSAAGIIPSSHEVYEYFTGPAVPVALVLMVFGLHLKEVIRLPIKIILLFLIGVLGSIIGGLVAGLIAFNDLGSESMKVAAQLTASYVGGGENAVAMQKMLDISNETFVAVFAVDNVVTSIWMALTLFWAKKNPTESNTDHPDTSHFDNVKVNIADVIVSIAVALLAVILSNLATKYFGVLHKIMYLSIFALALGQVPLVRRHTKSAYLIGSVIFAGFFFAIGAMSDFTKVAQLPFSVILMPFVVVGIHAAILFPFGYYIRTTSTETALVSQALIGGPATALALAQAKNWRSGISMSLVLGVLGYALGNFAGGIVFYILNFLLNRKN